MRKRKGHGPRPYSISAPDKYRLLIHWPGRQPIHFSTTTHTYTPEIAA